MSSTKYDIRLLGEDSQGSLASARIFLAYLFKFWAPKSVIDFGCGLGTWLRACRELGVERLVGLDGDWVTEDRLIDRAIEFRPTNFQQGIVSTETFDLAISLEVVEHLPPDAADRFVQSLIKSAGAVVFSAAYLGQPGAGHINTRHHSYWAHKFISSGYLLFDLFRPEFWADNRIMPWYRQNTFLYVRANHPLNQALMASGHQAQRDARFVDCIHPWLYLWILEELRSRIKDNTKPI
jgi:SAM-dependent methyltransferase